MESSGVRVQTANQRCDPTDDMKEAPGTPTSSSVVPNVRSPYNSVTVAALVLHVCVCELVVRG